jgi:hypothetical protein
LFKVEKLKYLKVLELYEVREMEEVYEKVRELAKEYGPIRTAVAMKEVLGLRDVRIQITREEELKELCDAIKTIRYNNYDGRILAKILQDLAKEGLIMEIEYGNEGSEVIYIQPPYWTHQAIGSKETWGRKYSKEEREKMFWKIYSALALAKPDELHIVKAPWKEEFWKVRAWWD